MFGTPRQFTNLLREYADGPAALREAVRGLDHGGLGAPVAGGPWTVRDNVLHLSDLDLDLAARIRRALTETPSTPGTIEAEAGKRRLQHIWRSVEAALAQLEIVRFSTAELLTRCDAAAWERMAPGEEVGVAELVREGVAHLAEHVAEISAARALRGQR